MAATPIDLNRTDARVAAMRAVIAGTVTYDSASGVYTLGGDTLTGAARRTYAELRTANVFKTSTARGSSTVELSLPVGQDLAREWGLTSPA
jgi:hypothetical protein